MKIKLGLAFASLILGTLIFYWYLKTGYRHYEWPFPQIVPLLRLDAESVDVADFFEILAWCVVSVAIILFGGAWITKHIRSRNKI